MHEFLGVSGAVCNGCVGVDDGNKGGGDTQGVLYEELNSDVMVEIECNGYSTG